MWGASLGITARCTVIGRMYIYVISYRWSSNWNSTMFKYRLFFWQFDIVLSASSDPYPTSKYIHIASSVDPLLSLGIRAAVVIKNIKQLAHFLDIHWIWIKAVIAFYGLQSFPGWLLSRMVFFPERRFPESRFPDGHFPGQDVSRKDDSRMVTFPERRFPGGHFPG